MSTLNNDLQTSMNTPTELGKSQTLAMNKLTGEPTVTSHSPETIAWLDRVAAAHDRMSTDEEYRKEVTRKGW